MKLLKKLLLVFFILFVLIIGALAVAPIIFKDDIVEAIKKEANNNLNARVDFGAFDLSLLSSFPSFKFEINDVEVIGKDQFASDTLLKVGHVSFDVDLNSVMSGDYKVNSFLLENVGVNAIVLPDSSANWDIAIADSSSNVDATHEEESKQESSDEETAFNFELSSYELKNIDILYTDSTSGMEARVMNFSHSGSFKMNGDDMQLSTNTSASSITYIQDGIKLANELVLSAKADLLVDNKNSKYVFQENEIRLNELNLGIDGSLEMPNDDIAVDLKIEAKNNTFREVLSLIPAAYKKDIAGIKTSGNFNLGLVAKGVYSENSIPNFDLGLSIKEGYFKYPDLPEAVENIQVEFRVSNQTAKVEGTLVDLDIFHFEVANNPIDLKFYGKDLMTDPDMKGEVKSKLNLEKLAHAIPMEEGMDYRGRLNANFDFAGKLSAIEQERYEDFEFNGMMTLLDFEYEDPTLPKTSILSMTMRFSPQFFELGNLEMTIGKSDLRVNGKMDNILPYVFHDDTLVGAFNVSSKYFDANEFLTGDSSEVQSEGAENPVDVETVTSTEDTSSSIFVVPSNVDFILNTKLGKVDYENMPIDNYTSQLLVRNGKVHFKDASFGILGGKIGLEGDYFAADTLGAEVGMNLSIQDMDIPTAYNTFGALQQAARIAKYAKGKFSTDFDFDSELLKDMSPNYNSMNGKGTVELKELVVEGHPMFEKLSKMLKNPKYSKISSKDLKISYEFKEGKIFVKPFDLTVGGSSAKVHGWTSFDQQMKYTFELKVPRAEFGGAANGAIDALAGQAGALGLDVKMGEFIFVDVIASGDVSDPKIKIVPKGMSEEGGSVKDQLTDKVKEVVTEKVDELKDKAKEEKERLQKEAEARIKAEEEKARKAKEEAEAKAKAELKKKEEELKKKAEEEKKKKEKEAKEKAKDKAKDLLEGWGK